MFSNDDHAGCASFKFRGSLKKKFQTRLNKKKVPILMEEQAIKEQGVQATRRKPFSVCTLIKESNQCKNK
jgi:hypothetical protein